MKTKKKQRNQAQQDCGVMFAQVQTSVEFKSSITIEGICSVQDYRRLFIRAPEVKARGGKMVYVRPEFHDRIMRIIRVIGHDRLSLSAYLDHVLAHHFKQCEEAIKSEYAKNYNPIF